MQTRRFSGQQKTRRGGFGGGMKTLEGMVDAIESRMRERLAAGSSQMLSKRCLSIDYEITTRSERLAEARKLLRKNGSERRTSIVLRMKVFAVILWEYLAHSPVEVVEVWRLVPDRAVGASQFCIEQTPPTITKSRVRRKNIHRRREFRS